MTEQERAERGWPSTADLAWMREALSYDPETGSFVWLKSSSYRYPAGRPAGRKNNKGYLFIGINGREYGAHRIAVFLVSGSWPHMWVDHMNGDVADNRFSNLRLATRAQNTWNSRVRAHSRSGIKGVRMLVSGRWSARIMEGGRERALGTFRTAEDAVAAYNRAAREIQGDFARPQKAPSAEAAS